MDRLRKYKQPTAPSARAITSRAAVCAGIALTALLNGLAVIDAGRDVDLELARLTNAALTAAFRTRLLDDLAGAAAVRAGALRLDLAQYREMEVFTQFSSDLDETTKRQLIYGQGLMRLLRQPQNHPYQQHQQVILLVAALDHVMQTVPLARMDDFRTGLLTYIETQDQALCRRIDESGQLSDEDRETILKLSREFLTRFQTEAAEKSGE